MCVKNSFSHWRRTKPGRAEEVGIQRRGPAIPPTDAGPNPTWRTHETEVLRDTELLRETPIVPRNDKDPTDTGSPPILLSNGGSDNQEGKRSWVHRANNQTNTQRIFLRNITMLVYLFPPQIKSGMMLNSRVRLTKSGTCLQMRKPLRKMSNLSHQNTSSPKTVQLSLGKPASQ